MEKSKRDLATRDMRAVEAERKRTSSLVTTLEAARRESLDELQRLRAEKQDWARERERLKETEFRAI